MSDLEDNTPEKMSDDIIRYFLENMTEENEYTFSMSVMDDNIFHGPAYMSTNFLLYDFNLKKAFFHFDSVEESNEEQEVLYKFEATFEKFKKLRELSDNFENLKTYYKLYGERVVSKSVEKILAESEKIIENCDKLIAYYDAKEHNVDDDQLNAVPECQRALYSQFLAECGPEIDDDQSS